MQLKANEILNWKRPNRYLNVKTQEVNTLISTLKIFGMIYERVQDKQLGFDFSIVGILR